MVGLKDSGLQPSCPRFWRNPNYDNPNIQPIAKLDMLDALPQVAEGVESQPWESLSTTVRCCSKSWDLPRPISCFCWWPYKLYPHIKIYKGSAWHGENSRWVNHQPAAIGANGACSSLSSLSSSASSTSDASSTTSTFPLLSSSSSSSSPSSSSLGWYVYQQTRKNHWFCTGFHPNNYH